ncbi:MAG: DUF2314 domain-containing protein [Acidimicrobiales bacterium]
MADDVVLPVPKVLSATYLVPTSELSQDLTAAARAYLAESVVDPLKGLVERVLDGPLCTIRVLSDPPELPMGLLRAFGTTDDDLRTLSVARHLIAVRVVYRPGWPPAHEWAARVLATGIASSIGAPVLDIFIPRLTSADRLAKTFPDERGRMRLADWVLVPHSDGDNGTWLTTKGLGRFGLPELQTTNVPPQLTQPWTEVLCGLAAVLVRWWAGATRPEEQPAFVELPTSVEIRGEDIAEAYGREAPTGATGSAWVRLALDPSQPSEDSFLSVLALENYPASTGEFLARVCADLFGHDNAEVKQATDNAAMDGAIATARAGLDAIRDRFVGHQLALEQRLMVKFRLLVPGGAEYPWLFVTSWKAADRVHGVNANDAVGDPSVRIGKPRVVAVDDIIDWAVWVHGPGIIEGGATNQALC